MSSLHRIYATICRLRSSWGFGVHSPNIYGLLTDVLREYRPYYAYKEIERLSSVCGQSKCTERVNKLLFRLVNYFQPDSLLEVGSEDGAGLKSMLMARRAMTVLVLEDRKDEMSTEKLAQRLGKGQKLAFLHIACTSAFRELYEAVLPLTDDKSVFIIEGIQSTEEKRAWWKMIEQDKRVGITIDLYDVGLVFFDFKRPRRNYRFNF